MYTVSSQWTLGIRTQANQDILTTVDTFTRLTIAVACKTRRMRLIIHDMAMELWYICKEDRKTAVLNEDQRIREGKL